MLRAETLTLKEKNKPLLSEKTARVEIGERETAKTPISFRILTKIEGKKAKIKISAILV